MVIAEIELDAERSQPPMLQMWGGRERVQRFQPLVHVAQMRTKNKHSQCGWMTMCTAHAIIQPTFLGCNYETIPQSVGVCCV